jgi:hypothetical protein
VREERGLDNLNEGRIKQAGWLLAGCWLPGVDMGASIRGESGDRPDTALKVGEVGDKDNQDGV